MKQNLLKSKTLLKELEKLLNNKINKTNKINKNIVTQLNT